MTKQRGKERFTIPVFRGRSADARGGGTTVSTRPVERGGAGRLRSCNRTKTERLSGPQTPPHTVPIANPSAVRSGARTRPPPTGRGCYRLYLFTWAHSVIASRSCAAIHSVRFAAPRASSLPRLVSPRLPTHRTVRGSLHCRVRRSASHASLSRNQTHMCVWPCRLILALKISDLITDSADQRRHPIAACTKRNKRTRGEGHSHAIL